MFFFLSWSCFSLPATFSLVGAALEAHRYSMGVGVQSVIKRLPIMIAPIFGGMLIDHFGIIPGVRIALVVSIFLSALTILVQRQLREHSKDRKRVAAATAPPQERSSFWRSLRNSIRRCGVCCSATFWFVFANEFPMRGSSFLRWITSA